MKTEEMKTEEMKTEEMKTEEMKTEEMKTEEMKTEEMKTEEMKTEEMEIVEMKTTEINETETRAVDAEQVDANKPNANKPNANKPNANKPNANEPNANKTDSNESDGIWSADAKEQGKPDKPSGLFQVVKALCYLALFVGSQVIALTVLQTIWGAQRVAQLSNQGILITQGELTEYLTQKSYENTNLLVICYVPVMFLILAIFFGLRRKNLLKEVKFNKFSAKMILPVIVLFVGLALFINAGLSLLPKALLEDYVEASSSVLGSRDLLLMLCSNVLFAPISEETIFRGLITSRLQRSFPRWISIAIASLLFGLVHGQVLWMIYAALLGVVMGIIADRADSVAASMLLHILFNAFGTILSYLGVNIPMIGMVIACIVGFVVTGVGFYLLFRQSGTVKKTA